MTSCSEEVCRPDNSRHNKENSDLKWSRTAFMLPRQGDVFTMKGENSNEFLYSTITTEHVEFWVTPKFHSMWWANCGSGAGICDFCSSQNDGDPYITRSFWTGESENSSPGGVFRCFGGSCGSFGGYKPLCGKLLGPILCGVEGKITDIARFNTYEARYIKCRYNIDIIKNKDELYQIKNLIYANGERTRFVPPHVAAALFKGYCLKTEGDGTPYAVSRQECIELKYLDERMYYEVLSTVCRGQQLAKRVCMSYCGERNVNCDERIEEFCKSMKPRDALGTQYSDLCGCFMGNRFYKGYFDEISKRYKFPPVTSPNHVCYFDYCASSNMRPYNEKQTPTKCPDVMMCFQNVNIDMSESGTINSGDIIIRQSNECSSIKRRCDKDSDCSKVPGTRCISGECSVPQPTPGPGPQPNPQPTPQPTPGPQPVPTPGPIVIETNYGIVAAAFILIALLVVSRKY